MDEHYISNPRPMFNDTTIENKKNTERLFMGSGSSGIIFDVSRKGIEVNGYYTGFGKKVKYANLEKPIFVSWEEFDKIRYRVDSFGKKNKNLPNFIDNVPDMEYLDMLPIVHINGKKYYVDGDRRERRAVANPKDVYKF